MIEQLPYAITPKYNFPKALQDLQLPQNFMDLSLRSMKTLRSERFRPVEADLFNSETENHAQAKSTLLDYGSPSFHSIPLKPLPQPTTITAIDVSNIRLGETDTGLLTAIRAAVVWRQKRQYKYLRLGPFPFHITEQNKQEVYDIFRQHYLPTSPKCLVAPSLPNMQNRIGNLLERWLQMSMSAGSRDNIILWDGSLTAGTPDNPTRALLQLLEITRNRLNTVLAFTKSTTLRLWNRRLTDLTTRTPPPRLIQINRYPLHQSTPICFLGNIYIAKLTNGSCSFRLDIDKNIPSAQRVAAVQKLLGNDLLFQGYPETLRLAHIYSTFTANEVLGIQRFIAQTYGLRVVTRLNLRRLLFGPYGKGPEA
ncbi:MAG: hypothetical protein JSV85_03140 [Candidatus Bathyarchaeota archaeon]|nr:MAG: hypothetical protein JSV85_03140 [Candidatus Bathyarchaeota archaeon]